MTSHFVIRGTHYCFRDIQIVIKIFRVREANHVQQFVKWDLAGDEKL